MMNFSRLSNRKYSIPTRFAKYVLIVIWMAIPFNSNGQDKVYRELSDQFLNYIQNGNGTEAYALCGREIRAAMSAEEIEDLWSTLESQFGAFKDTGELFMRDYKSNKLIYRKLNFELLPLYFKLTVDSNGLVSGIFFQPAEKKNAWSKAKYINYSYVKIQKTELNSNGYSLDAELTSPRSPGPFPTVILIHGSGPNDMDETTGPNKAFKDIAYGLATKGLAVYRYDKRTHTYGGELTEKEMTIQEIAINDVHAAIEAVKNFPEVDTSNIILLGHSLGGMIAGTIASESEKVKGVVIAASTARPMGELMEIQVKRSLDRTIAKGDTSSVKDIEDILVQIQYINTNEIKESTPDSLLPMGLPSQFWISMDNIHVIKSLKSFNGPVLIMHGEKDQQIFEEDYKLWEKSFKNNKKIKLMKFENLNHFLMVSKSEDPEEDYNLKNNVDEEVLNVLYDWILSIK